MSQLQGLIFDLDGTLLDSAPDLRQAMNKTLAAHGRREVSLDEIKSFCGDGMLMQVQRAFAATGDSISDTEAYKIFQVFIGHYRAQPPDSSQIYPFVIETLEHYSKQGVKLGICTNKTEGSTIKLLGDLQLAKYFDFVAGGDTFMVHKPHAGHILGVIEKFGVPAAGCVMVGDSRNDVLASHGAGIPCFVVTNGYGIDLAKLGADGLLSGLNELREALQRLGYEP